MVRRLEIQLLGTFVARDQERSLDRLATQRLQSLVGYLALRPHAPVSRRHLAALFWPDLPERAGFNNLRNLLYRLRQQVEDVERLLVIDAGSIRWHPDVLLRTDALDFEGLLQQAGEAARAGDALTERTFLEQAAGLYAGELLPGLYDDWILPERNRLHDLAIGAFDRLVAVLEDEREYETAIRYASRLVELDHLREPSYRSLIRLHRLNGDAGSAQRSIQACVTVLKEELGVEPDPETRALIERGETVGAKASHARERSKRKLVGRHREWRLLRDAWRETVEQGARLVVVTGVAGAGKTRLAGELLDWAARQQAAVARAAFYDLEGRLSYAAVGEWLRSPALRPAVERLRSPWRAEVARLLPELENPGDDVQASAPWQRVRFFDALARAILAIEKPTLLFLDDLQWCDQETGEWLRYLLRHARDAPLMVLATVRAEELRPEDTVRQILLELGRSGRMTEVNLGPLSQSEAQALAAQARGGVVTDDEAAALHEMSEGNPLFVVEIVRSRIRLPDPAGARPSEWAAPQLDAVPEVMQAVVRHRLAQLTRQARDVVAVAGVIGRSFSRRLLSEIASLDDEALADAVDELAARHIIEAAGAQGYDFTHGLIRKVAYADTGGERRRLLHLRAAEALRSIQPTSHGEQAAHLDAAGAWPDAVANYRKAVEEMQRLGADARALRYAQRALALLRHEDVAERQAAEELELQLLLILSLRNVCGQASDEVGEALEAADALVHSAGTNLHRFSVERSRWAFHLLRGQFGRATESAAVLQELARDLGDPSLEAEALIADGLTSCWRGELHIARRSLEQALALSAVDDATEMRVQFGQDPRVTGRGILSLVLALMGEYRRADGLLAEALQLAKAAGHAFSEAHARQHAMIVKIIQRRHMAAADDAAALGALAEEHDFAYWRGPAHIGDGWAQAHLGRPALGMRRITRGMMAHSQAGSRMSSTLWMHLKAEVLRETDNLTEALETVSAAIDMVEAGGERIWEAALHMLRGELLQATDRRVAEAAAEYRHAADVALRQSAAVFALRAAICFAGSVSESRRRGEAIDLLREVTKRCSSEPVEHGEAVRLLDSRQTSD